MAGKRRLLNDIQRGATIVSVGRRRGRRCDTRFLRFFDRSARIGELQQAIDIEMAFEMRGERVEGFVDLLLV